MKMRSARICGSNLRMNTFGKRAEIARRRDRTICRTSRPRSASPRTKRPASTAWSALRCRCAATETSSRTSASRWKTERSSILVLLSFYLFCTKLKSSIDCFYLFLKRRSGMFWRNLFLLS